MPAHNEAAWLPLALAAAEEALSATGLPYEVLVSENGSTDGTARLAEELARSRTAVRVLKSPSADYGRALRDGFLAARGEIVVYFDVDLVDRAFLERALSLMREGDGPDLVVGSKRAEGARDRRPAARRFVTAVFSAVLRHGFGLHVSDTHGTKALSREAAAPLVAACRFGGDIFDTELVLRAERSGLSVIEVPVDVAEIRAPRSPIGRRIARSLLGLLRLRLALWQEPVAGAGLGGARAELTWGEGRHLAPIRTDRDA
jgi:glycosyltransferase involved in cell wall biosynthesis